jgi:hypothetical protein
MIEDLGTQGDIKSTIHDICKNNHSAKNFAFKTQRVPILGSIKVPC